MRIGELVSLENLVLVAGVLHFCQLPAMVAAARTLRWKEELAKLSPINRRSVRVIGVAIVLAVLGLGVVVIVSPGEVAGGTRLGAALACFLGVFWVYRLSAQVFLYKGHWPSGRVLRAGYYAMNLLFVYLIGVYLAAFVAYLVS